MAIYYCYNLKAVCFPVFWWLTGIKDKIEKEGKEANIYKGPVLYWALVSGFLYLFFSINPRAKVLLAPFAVKKEEKLNDFQRNAEGEGKVGGDSI